jgi:hypothetical protein
VIERDDERLDFSQVPQSKGIPPMLYRIAAVGIIGIFAVGAAVITYADYGHVWPYAKAERIPLANTGNP